MSEIKGNNQTTDPEGLNTESKLTTSNVSTNVKPKSGKGQRSGKVKRTKKVIVKMPTLTRRFDDDHKLFPKGIDGMKGTLEQIEEESKEPCKVNGENDKNTNSENSNKENCNESKGIVVMNNMNTVEQSKEVSQNNDNVNETVSDQLYGMFKRTNTERSLLSTKSDSAMIPMSPKRRQSKSSIKRPKSSVGWTKKEIDLFLPRKSFFSVHDNTLSSAGFDIRSDEERKIPEWRKLLRMRSQDELYPPEEKEEEKPVVPMGFLDEESEEEFGLENVETAISAENKEQGTTTTKSKRRHKDKKMLNAEKEEYKPLYDYLKYIHDNPEEYIHANKYVGKNTDYRHPSAMVRLGRAYRRGHHGTQRHSIYLHAITELKKKTADTTPLAEQPTTTGTTQDETEIEKLRSKAEKWAKGLTTQQWLKARELALKDVGDEDYTMSKWWLVFRSCHYLRIPSHITDISH
ncbi:hypothetical protein ACF0H5_002090 [Mactra antiquata]